MRLLLESVSFLRPVEVLLKLVGVSLVVALLARLPSNTLATVFAFVLIGALIVPTPDLIRRGKQGNLVGNGYFRHHPCP